MNIIERIADLSQLWKQASIIFPYFDRQPINWDQTYQEYLPKVMTADDEKNFHLLLAEFINRLGDGHTDYLFPNTLTEKTGALPFSLVYLQGDYYIREIEPRGESHLLAKVIRINGTPVKELLAEAFRYIYHVGDYAYPSTLHRILPFLLNPAGNKMETSVGLYRFDLASSRPTLIPCNAITVPHSCQKIPQGKLDARIYEGNILYIKLNNFLYSQAADEIAAILNSHGGLNGVILDLRENIGGMTTYGAKVAELFIPGQFHACQKRTRILHGCDTASASQFIQMSEETIARHIADGLFDREFMDKCRKINANAYFEEYTDTFGTPGHKAMFSGPCMLLTSRNTISAAEDFTAMFRSNHRASIIGTPTCGSSGTPLIQPLSCGGRARICSVGYRLLDGTEFIGSGIMPDIPIEPSRKDFSRGLDKVLAFTLDQ